MPIRNSTTISISHKCITESEKIMILIKLSCAIHQQVQISAHFHKQPKFQDNVEISGQFQENSEISGFSGQLGPLQMLLTNTWPHSMKICKLL